jgi:hypothetical protein
MRACFIAVMVLALAPKAEPQQRSANSGVSGTVRGIVRFVAGSGKPSGVQVYIVRLGVGRIDGKIDESARFEFTNLPAGSYQVHVESEGYLSRNGSLSIVSPQITLTSTAAIADVEITAVKGGIISGKVTDERGQPVAGKEIVPLLVGYRNGKAAVAPMRVTSAGRALSTNVVTTDDRGEYRFYWLGPGEYYIRAGEAQTRQARNGSATASASNLARTAYFPSAPDLPSAARVLLKAGQELTGVDIRVPSRQGVKVSGKIVNTVSGVAPNRYVPNIDTFYLVPRGELNDDRYPAANVRVVGVGNEADFQITDLLPGVYELFAVFTDRSAGRGALNATYSSRTAIEVKDRDVAGIVATIGPNVPIRGRILWRDVPANFKWNGLQVHLRDEDLPTALSNNGGERGSPREDGTFLLPSVIQAQYKVLVWGLPENVYVSDLRWRASSIVDNPIIAVSSSENNELEISLRSDGGAARGLVLGSRGEPVATATVVLIPQGSRRGNPNHYKRAPSAADGSFSLQGIAPGEYTLFAWESLPAAGLEGGPEEAAEFVSRYESQGRSVSVRAGTTVSGVQLRLISTDRP